MSHSATTVAACLLTVLLLLLCVTPLPGAAARDPLMALLLCDPLVRGAAAV